MDKSKPAVDRVRPILQAMERSIDAARQRRTRDVRSEPPLEQPEATPPEGSASDGGPPRQRARPKRSTPLSGADDRSPLWPKDS